MFKILIRPLEEKDSEVSWHWRNDEVIWKYTGNRPNISVTSEIEREWIKKVLSDPSSKRFAITVDDLYIGNIQLTNINKTDAEYHIFIGNRDYWGKGVAFSATQQIIRYAKNVLNLGKIYLKVKYENIKAVRLYESCGFQVISKKHDEITMSLNLEKSLKPKVSIFCMVYNHEPYLKDCLEGFLMQKCNFDFEIVIGEDYSKDSSRAVILQYANKYPGKFKLLLHEQNIGAHQNQDIVFKNCTGEFIAICEGDDYWNDCLKLQKQVDFLELNAEYGLVVTDFNILNQTTGSIEESLFKTQPTKFPLYKNFEDFLYAAAYMAPCTWLLRKEFVLIQSMGHLDGSFALLLNVFAKSKVGFISDTTSVYRVLGESASHSSSIEKRYLRSAGVLKTQLDFVESYKLPESFKLKILQKYYQLILPVLIVLGKNEEIIKAKHYLPKKVRSFRDHCFFFLDNIPLGGKIIFFLYKLKITLIRN